MNRIVSICIASAVFAVGVTDANKGKPEKGSVWVQGRGLIDEESLRFAHMSDFNKVMFRLDDALKVINSHLEPILVLAVLKGKIPPADFPATPKLEHTLYHVFFLAKDQHGGIYYLPVAETKEGKGWTMAQPSFYLHKQTIMAATFQSLKKKDFMRIADFWHGYLSSVMPGVKV